MTDGQRQELIDKLADAYEERISKERIERYTQEIIDGAAEEAENRVEGEVDSIREQAEREAEEYVESLDLEAEEVEAQ
jgi:hypothetical protein